MYGMRLISNFMFGMECLGCGATSESLDPWLCSSCRLALERESKSCSFPNEDTVSLFTMGPLTRKLVHALKYKSVSGMAMYMVRRSSLKSGGLACQNLDVYARPFFFVPVPLHRARLRERGYNQAECIAAAMAYMTNGRVCRWLKRKSFVVSQTKLSKEEREWNVAGAFEANLPKNIPPRGTIFIVDDVFTTGATTSACVNALENRTTLNVKVCTLLYDEPASAVMDYVADLQMGWDL